MAHQHKEHRYSVQVKWTGDLGTGTSGETVAAGMDQDLARRLHEKARHLCFIANSVNFPAACQAEIGAG